MDDDKQKNDVAEPGPFVLRIGANTQHLRCVDVPRLIADALKPGHFIDRYAILESWRAHLDAAIRSGEITQKFPKSYRPDDAVIDVADLRKFAAMRGLDVVTVGATDDGGGVSQGVGTPKEPTQPAATGSTILTDGNSSTPMSEEETDPEEKSDSNGDGQLKRKLWALADQTAERIRKADGYVSLNAVCEELRKPAIRNDHRDLLYGQKGWHGDSWLKAKGRLQGWADPLIRK